MSRAPDPFGSGNGSRRYYVGVDAGSSATKCVVLDREGRMVGRHVVASGFDYTEAAEKAIRCAIAIAGASADEIAACVATGYGRERVRLPDGLPDPASRQRRCVTEITCHARGAREWYPEVRHIIDIGGQDTKVIRLCDQGRMADYRMNAKCAAGTGTFLETIAVRLALPMAEIDEMALRATGRLRLNSYCTVFTSTEVLERIKDGEPKQDIAMGVFRAIASRVLEMMPSHDGPVAATGGVVTYCRAMVKALEEVLQTAVYLPPYPQHAGAYGAALLALSGQSEGRHARTISLGVKPC